MQAMRENRGLRVCIFHSMFSNGGIGALKEDYLILQKTV